MNEFGIKQKILSGWNFCIIFKVMITPSEILYVDFLKLQNNEFSCGLE
jgi:hypothetical protein